MTGKIGNETYRDTDFFQRKESPNNYYISFFSNQLNFETEQSIFPKRYKEGILVTLLELPLLLISVSSLLDFIPIRIDGDNLWK